MGRHGGSLALHNCVGSIRLARGLSQQALAERSGLTRQTVSAIENGHYIPNTSVALHLAQALGCRVEELFLLADSLGERPVHVAAAVGFGSRRVALAQVQDRLIAYPLAADRAVLEGFASADGVIAQGREPPHARLLVSHEQLERTAVLMGCDPSLAILCAHLSRSSPDTRLVWLSATSRQALESVAKGEVHMAGSHLRNPDGRDYNVTYAHQALARSGGLVVAFAAWEQGFVVLPGNPKGIRAAADLARPDVRLINREPGAGCREFLDELLLKEGIPAEAVQGYERVVTSHLAVARTVAAGAADVGVTLRAAAYTYGLDFVPMSEVRFDLVVPRAMLGHPAVSATLEVLQSRALREELEALPGYNVTRMGSVVADIAGAS